MFRFVIALSMIFPLGFALAQKPRKPPLGNPSGADSESTSKATTLEDVIALYPNRKDAGLVAFKVGYEAARKQNTRRSIDLFLEALKREPSLVKALYNLGVECSVDERWDDARKFHEAYQQQPGADTKLVEAEIRRINELSRLSSTRKEFLNQYLQLVDMRDDNLAIVKAEDLSKKYPKEWEAPALAGRDLARVGSYQESNHALLEAAGRAPVELQSKLRAAADLARKELDFKTLVKNADQARQDGRYDAAAKLYSDAFKLSGTHTELLMNAATSHLMADDVDAAITDLAAARDARDQEISAKAIHMLNKLGPLSPEAASLGAGQPNASDAKPAAGTADQIAEQIGSLKTPEMLLVLQRPPDLLAEKTGELFPMPGDAKAFGDGMIPDFKSTDSIFEIYQRNVREAESQQSQQQAAQADIAAPPPAATDIDTRAAEPPRVQPPPASVKSNSGPLQTVSVTTVPDGAAVLLDESGEDGPPQHYTSPCQLSLAIGSRHTLLVTLDGYRIARKTFNVERGGQNIPFRLDEKSGLLGLPKMAGIVQVDGQTQQTPALIRLRAGEHDISFELNGQVTTRKVVIEDEKTITLHQLDK
jgi:tetratricopeptide (TPR) repeat protein